MSNGMYVIVSDLHSMSVRFVPAATVSTTPLFIEEMHTHIHTYNIP